MLVTVLNTTYTPLHDVSVRHAHTMLWRGVADVVEEGPGMFAGAPTPSVLLLRRYVPERFRYGRRPRRTATFDGPVKQNVGRFADRIAVYSKDALLVRDRGRCAYCGQFNATTADHVLPKSRGGPTAWLNTVAACEEDNWIKGDRTPDEAGMPLLWQPFAPTAASLDRLRR